MSIKTSLFKITYHYNGEKFYAKINFKKKAERIYHLAFKAKKARTRNKNLKRFINMVNINIKEQEHAKK